MPPSSQAPHRREWNGSRALQHPACALASCTYHLTLKQDHLSQELLAAKLFKQLQAAESRQVYDTNPYEPDKHCIARMYGV